MDTLYQSGRHALHLMQLFVPVDLTLIFIGAAFSITLLIEHRIL